MISKLLINRKLNTLLLLIYFFCYSYLLFLKEKGFSNISFILVSIFTFLAAIAIYNFSKLLYRIFLILCIILFIPFYIANVFVGGLDNAHFMAMYLTNFYEANSYFKVIPKLLFVKSLFIIAPLFYFLKAKQIAFNKMYSAGILGFIVLYSAFKYYKSYDEINANPDYSFRIHYVAPVRIIARSLSMFSVVKKELDAQKALLSKKDTWKTVSVLPDSDVYVVIIGESVRRDFMGCYNPKVSSTPFLKSIPKIQFNSAISFGPQTIESLTASFMLDDHSGNPFFPNNIINLSKKAGFSVNWISNQGAIGVEDNYIAAMGNLSNYTNFVSKGRWNEHVEDEKMIEVFRNKLNEKKSQPQVFFMHMIGSHPDPCDITGGKYREFLYSKNLSCYKESIKRTDEFIKEIYGILKEKSPNFKMVYFSDHGLYLEEKERVYHRLDIKQSYDIPLFIIDPKLQENVLIDEPRNLKDFLVLYSQLLQIKTENIKPTYNFISNDKAPNPYKLYNNLDYRELPDNSIPY